MKNLLVIVVSAALVAGCGGGSSDVGSQTEFKTLPSNMTTAGGN